MKKKFKYAIIFSAIIVASNYLVQTPLNDWFTAGAILFPLGFLLTDIITEKEDETFTREVVKYGVIIAFIPTLLIADWRIAIASILAYYISQNLDIGIFSYLKRRYKKMWYVRNNVSTILSQTVDSFLFFFIAFYGIMPTDKIIMLAIGTLGLKVAMAILDTPFFYYFGVRK